MRGATVDPGAPPQQMWETAAAPGLFESSSELELSFGDDIMQAVKDYTKIGVAEINVRPQGTRGDPPLAVNPACTRSSTGASASTSGA